MLSFSRFLAANLTFIGLLLITPAAQAKCANALEAEALDVRVLQSDLMVAALACNQQPEYNAFVKKFSGSLSDHGQALRGYFTRIYRGGAERKINRFITDLANDAAQRSLNTPEDEYCETTRSMFQQVDKLMPWQLAKVVEYDATVKRHAVERCNGQFAER